ncbi:circularly permuted type 2 ATP-grasp protein [Mangrovibrevibacter kandeliae]|uniref:circularly permuted type 2 ATP-grasp protein n=1 Tax=Mangrovibrevibacter kandeliae TaxID=2968473 RepID=UPI002118D140|nr:circularly permuted type 2 ATP-grasp protein [Aurantimonas sp. CSK15Z-1]MCQ8780607.1 circularly permuted type 2 ATP-grasp protein [Aurantimonas sp. CSK15Z-1]
MQTSGTSGSAREAGLGALLRAYRPAPGRFDEMLGPDGAVRPHYQALAEQLAAMPGEERLRRFARAGQYLREAGVFYRVYGGGAGGEGEHVWPLAHPPLILERREWDGLAAGLVERAGFLERLLADLFGERRLIADGVLPGRLLGANPEFLRPLADQALGGEPLIRFIAVDLGRTPDGRWIVLGDRTQAPSGAGFALENRVAATAAFPELARQLGVERLAGFFSRFRDGLLALDGREDARIGLLTPGPYNETYFEHAYLARYLGFTLVEGGDLVAGPEGLAIRTIGGRLPIRVLWRRLDADFADPLELYAGSAIGTPGLVRAVRAGRLHLANALGSGLLESRALLALQPQLAAALLGAPLRLPVRRTRWPGGDTVPQPREHAAAWDRRPALPPAMGAPRGPGGLRLMDDDDAWVVEQQRSPLSTMPVFVDGVLQPRPLALRVFLARDAEGWHVMPGGFARIAEDDGADAMSMQAGGLSADVWVTGDGASPSLTLLAQGRPSTVRRDAGALPARAADNLFWLGRYAERLEGATRLLRLHAGRCAEAGEADALAERTAALLRIHGIDPSTPTPGLAALTAMTREPASRIRDRFSPDAWRLLGEIAERLEAAGPAPDPTLAAGLLTRLSGFAGLVADNMYRLAGWHLLQCGRLIERGQATARTARALLAQDTPEGAFEALLELTDSRMTYRRSHSVTLAADAVIDLTLLDPLNPRSLVSQAELLVQELLQLTPAGAAGSPAPAAEHLRDALRAFVPGTLDDAALERVASDFASLSDRILERYVTAPPAA